MVVGKKSKPVGVMYVAVEVFFLIIVGGLVTQVEASEVVMVLLIGAIFLGLDGVILFLYVRTPSDAIILNYDKSITLPGYDVTLSMTEVKDISYVRARAKGIRYKWGKVIIATNDRKYVVRYLSECEKVAKTLMESWYEYKHSM